MGKKDSFTVTVPVTFRGHVRVQVPGHIARDKRRKAAETYAKLHLWPGAVEADMAGLATIQERDDILTDGGFDAQDMEAVGPMSFEGTLTVLKG